MLDHWCDGGLSAMMKMEHACLEDDFSHFL